MRTGNPTLCGALFTLCEPKAVSVPSTVHATPTVPVSYAEIVCFNLLRKALACA